MRLIYSLAWWLALPLVAFRLWRRSRLEPGYLQHVAERFGFYDGIPNAKSRIWVHAVSVGETRAAEPLIRALLERYPQHDILLTHMTPTGRAAGQALFGNVERVVQAYLPYDTGWMMSRLIRYFRPVACVLMETEIWPNLIAQCNKRGVPVALVNARLSQRSMEKGLRLQSLMIDAARGFALVAAQTQIDAERLSRFGAPNVQVTGSIKFDVAPPVEASAGGEDLRARIGRRPVLMCASTREGEEAPILDALPALDADALALIVPRHPQRFDEVAAMIEARGLAMQRRSSLATGGDALPLEVRVLLGDSMGEMFAYYAACDVAFIGGSLLPLGGQNLIEACALGKPVLVGPHTFNFEAVTEDAIAAGAARRVQDAAEMVSQANSLLRDPTQRAEMGAKASAFALEQRGATERTMELLGKMLD